MAPEIASLLNWAEPVIHSYGYLGVATVIALETLGLPLPGETMLIAAAVLSGRHMLDPTVVGISAWTGAILGDNVAYLIGRFGGLTLLRRFGSVVGASWERLDAARRIHRRYGAIIVVGARFVPIIRQLNGLLAGSLAMPWRRFVLFDAVGTGLWVAGWVFVGNVAGMEIAAIMQLPRVWSFVGLGVLIAAIGAVLVFLRRWRRRQRVCDLQRCSAGGVPARPKAEIADPPDGTDARVHDDHRAPL
jgi:membrane protein DedA with SNARE-associated domain